mmetsp:Transcript_29478/g.36571  ORF Transcript_29478/g.36571 Transcript_29478/m.36571 type:complete len:98 (-) Transcript_29478:129-422(-)|eukprot:CAMPEP_0170473340 /NCGR_PEP_ID=MMETSP0123-20130129/15253_1 /TAXON_ID=182087 /ORGANISM="Favella ehrenbergii, Strain Fehren 1" /LENGTH=97 /DNA_ID=CAMNT_0010742277 /DNA_START=613 /DNA_END=906 /DNA_ORIENTATION=-
MIDIKLPSDPTATEAASLLESTTKQAKKHSKKFVVNVRQLAKALNRGVSYLSGREDSDSDLAGLSTTDYCSELMSDVASDEENSKYGINALRAPIIF